MLIANQLPNIKQDIKVKQILIMFKKYFNRESFILLFISAVSLVSHWNTFFFPAYREDEGTYVAQAWAVLNNGSLAPYTYWYDHSPVGWLFIAIWNALTQGWLETGNSIISGRIFIMLLNICSACLVYIISRKLTQSYKYSILSALMFILTPLAIEFQRRVFLDNIMVFWLLISVYFSINPLRLRNVVLSAITFSIAVLSKESAVVFLPVIITSIYINAHKNNKPFVTASWLTFTLAIISFYPLYALLKGEFFIYGKIFGGVNPHVSFLDTLFFQAGRSSGNFWESTSAFQRNLRESWLNTDSLFIFIGMIFAPLTNIIFFRKYKWTGFMSMMALIYIAYLMRGQVLDWYIIPLLPIGAINTALLFHNLEITMKKRLPKLEKAYSIVSVLTLLVIIGVGFKNIETKDAYRYNQTENQRRATDWVKSYIQDETTLLIDNYAFNDVNPKIKKITDTNIHYYYKADPTSDPEISEGVFDNRWENVDYIMITPAVLETLAVEDFDLVQQALDNSKEVIKYNEFAVPGDPAANYPVEIREVNNFDFRLKNTWDSYKREFIFESGQVVDKQQRLTTSEGQSYALQKAIWVNDQETFDSVWNWTSTNLQKQNGLFAWKTTYDSQNVNKITDDTSASDADIDIAFALLQASKKWNNPKYLEQAQIILNGIWTNEVVDINGTYYLLASDNAIRPTGYLTNASYYSPGMFRVFADATGNNPLQNWAKLADDSYVFLNKAQNPNTGLVSNWNIINSNNQVLTASQYIPTDADTYGYDAFRTYYRVALDKTWYNNQEASEFLNNARNKYFQPYWDKNYNFPTTTTTQGEVIQDYTDISTHTGALSVFLGDPTAIDTEVYLNTIKKTESQTYWGDPNNYYDQNWGWFATALYGEKLTNYWIK
jgi:endo-1,4-beta-D-glucanase Y